MVLDEQRTLSDSAADAVNADNLIVRKRDGREVSFDHARISHAIEMAFRAEMGIPYPDPIASTFAERIRAVTDAVVASLPAVADHGNAATVEEIQDEVERQLMATGAYSVARRYILYREARARARDEDQLRLRDHSGQEMLVNRAVLRGWIADAATGLGPDIQTKDIEDDVLATVRHGMALTELDQAIVMAGRSRIEQRPIYSSFAARALLRSIYSDVVGRRVNAADADFFYAETFIAKIHEGIENELLTPELATFDLERLGAALRPERDEQFLYLGLQTLFDRYLIHNRGRRIELPQAFWMRVSMGLALGEVEDQRNDRAIEFYTALSTFRVCSSSPTLFNAGTLHAQLSSCYLTTVSDDLDHIFKSVRDNALLSKWSGGLGNDWTNVRALGSRIKGTNGESQGVIPFLKVVNDAAVAVNQGGKRKGAVATYLEIWHSDIEEYLELRKNTGDERRRTHDMNTATWIPDLFMQRVEEDGEWTLFSPNEVPDLHDLYGKAFKARYEEYEALHAQGAFPRARTIRALDLWRRLLSATFETGHPWITFKDPANVRSPQDHAGVVHNSNLCTEILLNTSQDEVAVCNLASINLLTHMKDGVLDAEMIGETVKVAIRMLDNVIDINYYPIPEAANSNQKHRPIGLGIMGFQDALWKMGLSYASDEAMEFADRSMELISWHAIYSSSQLAAERGAYPSFKGSKWDRNLLPIDTIALLAKERGEAIDVDMSISLDWEPVRESIRQNGMRNSNTMAIAPTATISNIQGVAQSIEPIFSNLFVKSNLSGEFTIANESLVAELDAQGIWDADMLEEIKYWDGSIALIERIPLDIRMHYPTAFEVEPAWLIEAASRRQKWIDMGQSLNLYISEPSGKKLHDMYFLAWKKGLKTTYYLRSRGATQAEKSTLDVNRFGIQPRWMKSRSASSHVSITRTTPAAPTSAPQARLTEAAAPDPSHTTLVPKAVVSVPAPAAAIAPRLAPAPAQVRTPLVPKAAPMASSEPAVPVMRKPDVSVPFDLTPPVAADLPVIKASVPIASNGLSVEEEFECEACQ
ncbi:MAG TPA: ribonucleoside-diphosphate reductase subunit alpha [Thermomicrobiales bacterium]|nr:ribonucleoside-diphosphate reductase subunit alpha [Thermomicrobiales bacterium]